MIGSEQIKVIRAALARENYREIIIQAVVMRVTAEKVVLDCMVGEIENGDPLFEAFEYERDFLERVVPLEVGAPVLIVSFEKPGTMLQFFQDGTGFVDASKFPQAAEDEPKEIVSIN